MNEQTFACFGKLPEGLLKNPGAMATGWWNYPEPKQSDFQLTAVEMDQSAAIQLRDKAAEMILAASVVACTTSALHRFKMVDLFPDGSDLLVIALIALTLVWYCASLIVFGNRASAYFKAESRRNGFQRADDFYRSKVLPWRYEQKDPSFWRGLKPGKDFEVRVADLVLGLVPDGSVSLTVRGGKKGDRYADVIACSEVGQ